MIRPSLLNPSRSLARFIVLSVGGAVALSVAVMAWLSFEQTYDGLESQVIRHFQMQMRERGVRESAIFLEIERFHAFLRTEFVSLMERYPAPKVASQFQELFKPWPDGTQRTREQFFQGRDTGDGHESRGMTGFVGRNTAVDDACQRRLVAAFELARHFGPAFEGVVENLYLSFYDNAGVIYWSERPWDLEVGADFDMTTQAFWTTVTPEHCPSRSTQWTSLYFDDVAQTWTVSCLTPVDWGARHVATIGSDMLLQDLVDATLHVGQEGVTRFIMRQDGELLLHQDFVKRMKDGPDSGSASDSSKAEDLTRVFALIQGSEPGQVINDRVGSQYLAYSQIEGPDWFLVTTIPRHLLLGKARRTALSVLGFGLLAILLVMLLTFFFLHKKVFIPLRRFSDAANSIREGASDEEALQDLSSREDDEIGRLARSFKAMLAELNHREQDLRESESRFRSFVENANDVVYALSSDGVFTYVSPNWLDVMGEPSEAATGRFFEPYVHPEDVSRCRDFLSAVVSQGEKRSGVEYRVKHANGTWRWHVSNGSPMRGPDGEVSGYVGIARDVTDAKKIEQELYESRELLEATGRMARVGGWELDAETQEVTWTSETYRIHELPMDVKPPLQDAINFFHPEDRPRLEDAIQKALTRGQPYDLELRFITARGRHLVTRTMCTAIVENGKIKKLRGTFHDITDRKRAERELSAIYQMSLALICIADIHKATFTRVNPAFKTILGYDDEELLEQPFYELIHPDDVASTEAVVSECLQKGETVIAFENRYRHKDGSYRWLLWHSHPDLEFGVTYAVAMDITEQKRLADRVRQMEKMDAVGQLAGGVAHDFNNQLGGIVAYADLLRYRLADDELKRFVEGILVCARRSADLTSKLLAFARKGNYQMIPVDIHDIVHETVDFLKHSIDKRINIKQVLAASPSQTIGDPTQLQNAVLNLAINAADAMKDGGELVFDTLSVELDEEVCSTVPYEIQPGPFLRLCVSDTGCGIPKEDLDRIFEPFFTSKEIGKGTGMGLSAAYGTVKQHGGAIKVYSEVGLGTTFKVFLPQAPREVEQSAPKVEPKAASGSGRILAVDDEEMLLDGVKHILMGLGYDVVTQPHGQAAIRYFKEHWQEVDLVILDMVMPKMNGPETFAAMKEIDPDVRVLLASGYSVNGAAQGLLAEGVKGFIQKPFERAELADLVRRVMNPDA